MKKIILTAGVFLIAYVVFSSVIVPPKTTAFTQTETVAAMSAQGTTYTVKSENGRIVVYLDDALYLRTSTAVNTLPKKDQKTLLYGIVVTSKNELKKVLESYCS